MVWVGNVCAGELCVFIKLCVCFRSALVFVVWAFACRVCVDGDVWMFSLVWGQCRSLGSTPKGFVCASGYIPHALRTGLVGGVCDVY